LYASKCQAQKCKINSKLFLLLKEASTPVTEIDLSSNYVGANGLLPVLDVFSANATVTRLDMSKNGVTDDLIPVIAEACLQHKGITWLNLSFNEDISEGKFLLELLKRNPNITDLHVEHTGMYESMIDRIKTQVQANQRLARSKPNVQPAASPLQGTKRGAPVGQPALTLPGAGGKGTLFANPEKWTGYVMAKEGRRYADDNEFRFLSPPKNRQIMRHTGDFGDLDRTLQSPAEITERRVQEQDRVMDAVLSMHDQPKATDLKALREEQQRLLGTTLTHQSPRNNTVSELSTETGVQMARERQQAKWKQHLETTGAAERVRQQEEEQAKLTGTDPKTIEEKAADLARREDIDKAIYKNAHSQEYNHLTENQLTSPRFSHTHDYVHAKESREVMKNAQLEHEELARTQTKYLQAEAKKAKEQEETERLRVAKAEKDAKFGHREGSYIPKKVEVPLDDVERAARAERARRKQEDEEVQTAHTQAMQETYDELLHPIAEALRQEFMATLLNEPKGIQWDEANLDADDVRFRQLYISGAKQYCSKEKEEAYQTLNEAMALAKVLGRGTWEEIVQANLYCLSFQLLVIEGCEHVQTGGKLDQALRCFELAREVGIKVDQAQWVATAEEAVVQARGSDIQYCHRKASIILDRLEKDEDLRVWPGTWDAAETALRERKRVLALKEAVDLWSQALTLFRQFPGTEGQGLGQVLDEAVGRAFAYEQTHSFSPCTLASPPYGLGHRIFVPLADRLWLLDTWTEMAGTLGQMGAMAFRALAELTVASLHYSVYSTAKGLLSARRYLDFVLDGPLAEAKAVGHMAMAVGIMQEKRPREAEREIQKAIDCWLVWRKASPEAGDDHDPAQDVRRLWAFKGQQRAYRLMEECLVTQHRYREALEFAERGRALAFDDLLHRKLQSNFKTFGTVELMQSVTTKYDTQVVVYSMVYSYTSKDDLWSPLEDNPSKPLAVEGEPTEVDREEILYVWVLPQGGEVKFMQIEVTKQYGVPSLQTLVLQLREAMEATHSAPESSSSWQELSKQLYDFLIYPVIDFLNANGGYTSTTSSLTLMPDTFLWAVPFNALANANGEFLIEKFAVSMALSVTMMMYHELNASRLRDLKRKRTQALPAFVFGDTIVPDKYVAATVAEGQNVPAVAQTLEVNPRVGTHANGPNVRRALECAGLVHLSAPVVGVPRREQIVGGLALADDEGGGTSQLLFLRDLTNVDQRCELLTLCSTTTNGRDGLAAVVDVCRAAASHGVVCTLFTLWASRTVDSTDLYTIMYKDMLFDQTLDKAQSVALAVRKLLKDQRDQPLLWAAPVVMGWSRAIRK